MWNNDECPAKVHRENIQRNETSKSALNPLKKIVYPNILYPIILIKSILLQSFIGSCLENVRHIFMNIWKINSHLIIICCDRTMFQYINQFHITTVFSCCSTWLYPQNISHCLHVYNICKKEKGARDFLKEKGILPKEVKYR